MADRAPDPRMLSVLKKAVSVLNDAGIPFALAGSMACWALGGPPSRHDVDLALQRSGGPVADRHIVATQGDQGPPIGS